MIESNRRWLSGKDLAKYLACSPVTIWRHSKNGLLPAPVKLGNGFARYDVLEVDAMLEASRD